MSQSNVLDHLATDNTTKMFIFPLMAAHSPDEGERLVEVVVDELDVLEAGLASEDSLVEGQGESTVNATAMEKGLQEDDGNDNQ